MRKFIEKFTVLKTAPRELWATYAAYMLEIVAYGVMNSTLVLWLSADLGMSDVKAGSMIAIWSTVMSVSLMLSGSFADAIGIRSTFMIGFGICLACRFLLAFVTVKWLVIPFGLFLMAVGLSMTSPVMNAAVRRFSSTPQRSIAFSLYYAIMNLGFAIAGWMLDFIRGRIGEHGVYIMPVLNIPMSAYRMIFLWAAVVTIPAMLILFFLRNGVEATDEGVVIAPPETERPQEQDAASALAGRARAAAANTFRILADVWKQPAFHKFLVFLSLVVGVKLIYYHLCYTFPKYCLRELGDGAPVGRLFWVINPVCVIILVPIVGALTQKIAAYKMVIFGSLISALSVFFMAMPPEWFHAAAQGWLGHLIAKTWLNMPGDIVNPLYIAIPLAMVVYSIGEAFWSPRLYEYTAAIAPKGQEASYMALSTLPFFAAKFFVGMMSGAMLAKYCPATGPRNSEMLWLMVGAMALITPFGLLALRKKIQVHESGRQ
ncbi:MAG: MFS transporter [Elusimicrobiales bacterium]